MAQSHTDGHASRPHFEIQDIRHRELRLAGGMLTTDAAPGEDLTASADLAALSGAPVDEPVATNPRRRLRSGRIAPVDTLLRREATYRHFLGLADSFGALGAITIVGLIWGAGFHWEFLLAPLVAVTIAKVQGLYDRDDMVIHKSTLIEWRAVLRAQALIGIGSYVLWYTTNRGHAPHGIRAFALLVIGGFVLTLPARAIARRLARACTPDERCLIIGTPERCERLAAHVKAIHGVDLIGTVSHAAIECTIPGIKEIAENLNVHRIVIGPHPAWRESSVLELIQSAKWLGVRVSLMPTVMTVVGATTAVDELDSMVLLGVPTFGLSRSSELLKRSLDLLVGTLTLIAALPVMLVIALLIRIDSEGPALFRQKRIGRDGEAFTMYKFRSMVQDADKLKAGIMGQNQSNGLFKMENDPRVTRIGNILRKTYLDELPQLVNVLLGNMSLVGPRPLIESEDKLLTGSDRHRSRLTPGMTGPWQLRGPINASLSELAKLDYLYASNWNVWKDVDILVGTAARVVNRGGH